VILSEPLAVCEAKRGLRGDDKIRHNDKYVCWTYSKIWGSLLQMGNYKITILTMFCTNININIKVFPVIIRRGRTRNADLSNFLNNMDT
jgi:hypothetical protein